MGNEQSLQSGLLAVPTANVQAANRPKPSNFDPKRPTGVPLFDSGAQGVCNEKPNQDGCFLSEKQRAALVYGYGARVDDVGRMCHAAVERLEIEQLIKNTDELPWYASLIVSALAAVVTEGLSLAIEGGVGLATATAFGAEAKALDNAMVADLNVARMRELIEIRAPLTASKPSPAKAITKKGVDTGKQLATPLLGKSAGTDSDATREKTTSVGYLQYIDRALTTEIDNLKQSVPGVATDAELLVLWECFDPKKYTKEMFIERARSMLDRYLHSHASQLGRRLAWDERRGGARVELETRAAWLITKGAGIRLIYVDRAFDAAFQRAKQEMPSAVARSSAYDSGTHQLSLQDDGTWTTPLGDETRHEKPLGPDLMLNYVEPEFVDVVLEAQEQIWLAPPQTFMLDYSYGAPRIIKVAS